MPSYPAARIMVEMLHASSQVLHLVHPRPTPLRELIQPIADALGARVVSYAEWLEVLESTGTADAVTQLERLRDNPALKLLSFFRANSMMSEGTVSTQEAVKASKELERIPVLGPGDSKRWLTAWRASGFL